MFEKNSPVWAYNGANTGTITTHKRDGGCITTLIRMDIHAVIVGGGPISSLLVLCPHDKKGASPQLPIRIGPVEASAISIGVEQGIEPDPDARPITHDLLANTITALGATLDSVTIKYVKDTTFYATLDLTSASGKSLKLDARPSDAVALAVRMRTPIYADERVLESATLPDFTAVENEEKRAEFNKFHEFVQALSPEDFANS